ncbi:MAG: tetratricopeptide repeat protein [Planctomycetales bacterium]|nr:tetratricopeptide repeat protein [Planctomycetales bacterium]
MRVHWGNALFACLLAGCTGPSGGPGAPMATGVAMQPSVAPTSYAANGPGFYQQPPSEPSAWTKFVDAITPGSGPENTPTGLTKDEIARRQQLDPLALSHSTGTPSAQLYVSMAGLSEQAGNVDQARDLYQKALGLHAEHGEALLGLARLEDRAGRLPEAQQLYHRAAAAYPDNPTILNDLALCYARAGELPRALGLLDRTTRLAPQNALYRNNIAKVLVEMNLLNDAVTHQMAVHPPAVAQYNVGVLLLQRDREQEAAQFFTSALTADPTLEPAREILAEIAGSREETAAVAPAESPSVAWRTTPAGQDSVPYPTTSGPQAITNGYAVPAYQAASQPSPMLLPPVH